MRASSLPRYLACPSSEAPVDHPYDPPTGEVGVMGIAVHEALAVHAVGGVPDLGAISQKHGVDANELERLFAFGCIAWGEIGEHFPDARTEMRLEGTFVHGTADVFHHGAVSMGILDWKAGFVKRDYWPQLLGYAAAAVDQFGMPESGEIKVVVVWLRFFEYEVRTFTAADIDRLHDDMKRAKLQIGKRYAPGDPCTYCCSQLVCKARHEYLAAATSALVPSGDAQISPERLPGLYTRSRHLRKALDMYDKALRMALEDGPLPDGDGNMLELVDTKRDKLIPKEAIPLMLDAGFSSEDMAACLSVSKTYVMGVISGKASMGQCGKAKAAFMDTLREAGAVRETHFKSIKVNKGADK